MPSITKDAARRIQYATGYLGLGMLNEASDELEAIEGDDRLSAAVMEVRCDLYTEGKQWDLLIAVARELARLSPESSKGWICWAFALRELNRIAEAKAVLFQAEPLHGRECIELHHNLACYHCLLGEMDEARERLRTAFKMDGDWKREALEDPDLSAIRDEIRQMT